MRKENHQDSLTIPKTPRATSIPVGCWTGYFSRPKRLELGTMPFIAQNVATGYIPRHASEILLNKSLSIPLF